MGTAEILFLPLVRDSDSHTDSDSESEKESSSGGESLDVQGKGQKLKDHSQKTGNFLSLLTFIFLILYEA